MHISFPSAHLFNTWLINSPGWISKRIEKAGQESECPTFPEIPVISSVSLKFSAYPTEAFKVLASLSMPELTTYLRIISYPLLCMTLSSTIANQTFNPQKHPLHRLKLGSKTLHFLDRIMAKKKSGFLMFHKQGWAARGTGFREDTRSMSGMEIIPAETPLQSTSHCP